MSVLFENYKIFNDENDLSEIKPIEQFYVYRFISKDEIIYVGQTIDIDKRMHQHFYGKQGHLKKECYRITNRVEYIELSNKTEMNIAEIYFINKYNPKYNSVNKYEDTGITLDNLDNKKWKIYKFKENIKQRDNNKKINLEQYKKEKLLKKQVVLLNNGKIFNDALEAANYMGVTPNTIKKYIKGEGIGYGKPFKDFTHSLWIKYENLFNLTDKDYERINIQKNMDDGFRMLNLIDLNYRNIEPILTEYYELQINLAECKKQMNLIKFINSQEVCKYKKGYLFIFHYEKEEELPDYIFDRYNTHYRKIHRISTKFVNYKDDYMDLI